MMRPQRIWKEREEFSFLPSPPGGLRGHPSLRGPPCYCCASSCSPCSMHFIKRWHRLPSWSRANSEVTTNKKNFSRAGVLLCWSRSFTGVIKNVAGDGRLGGQQSSYSRNSGGSRFVAAKRTPTESKELPRVDTQACTRSKASCSSFLPGPV